MDVVLADYPSRIHGEWCLFLGMEIMNVLRKDILQDKAFFSPGSTRLVHYGNRFEMLGELVDISQIIDCENFAAHEIHNFNSVEPDILLFHKNPYIQNDVGTYFAGFPDLLVEVWSNSNGAEERKSKLNLYSSAPTTEHWYIEEDSDKVERWLGKTQLEPLSAKNKLVTQNGLELDISKFMTKLLEREQQ